MEPGDLIFYFTMHLSDLTLSKQSSYLLIKWQKVDLLTGNYRAINMMSDDGEPLLVVYDDHSDQRSISLDETSSAEESPDETKLSLETTSDAIPYIGQRFVTHDHAYEFYMVFDTTHRLNAFDMPLGIWVGMNNYGMPCFFGCALLREENLKSYSWALKAFLGFMNGKVPQTILTDQTLCVREAIAMEMPSAIHAYCIWLIIAKFPSWFNAVLGERYNEWKSEFYRLYNVESIEDFEMGWRDMVNSFGLHTNRHINTLFGSRTLWALPYLRSHFFAGMTTTAHSKAINAFIQRFLSAQSRLAHFIEQVAVAVDFKDQAGEQKTMQQNLQNICLKTGAPMESHAASVLTPFAFSKLQEQLVLAAHYASFQLEDGFLVRHHTKLEGGRKVYWVPREGLISCSCHHFEFSGILCRHALRVLSTGNCFQIPERYMPLRWRRINTSAKLLQNTLSDHTERVQLLQGMLSNLVSESVKSKDRLDIAMEHVSVLLSRIRDHPVPSSRYARNDCFT
ncbi:hypothetical protein L1987_49034 [Smallanthus sonchifolius]|uniref:Uncharacterized protein n=1 Tax=Smallanthus sonchifolius TaxID=185202 RepID=A0ACB9FU82_9ASTR|nr:hypothetical protein L1987_49034 [Smallanthus sonchifolius]